MFESFVYQGNSLLGEVQIHPQNTKADVLRKIGGIRISRLSPPSERCPPLAVLHTIAPGGVLFKMESKPRLESTSPISALHDVCFRGNKTAVMPLGEEELHLVAMNNRSFHQCSCFWGFVVSPCLYGSSLVMLNLRCLGIVFDLDETLIVANTMRSFEDRIDALQQRISIETDPQRISGMLSQIKRYEKDKSILKQYSENDQVVENGKVIKFQSEVVPPLSDSHQQIIRPLIRLQDKNIILTRINPGIRDTSVFVRLRPAWEELRKYLTARDRKRFEVYVCTMAERDYALEMWRLLDPDSNLITSRELLDRIVCVKSGSRKSLINVFHDGICHPKMALVIDDRLKVWDDKDRPRVHVVPAFAPYYAPQAEASNSIPILCVARNVACNVRGGFYKEFDECLLQQTSDILYEDDIATLPSAPDVSNYLISEKDDGSISNGNKEPLLSEGMKDAKVERNLKDTSCSIQVIPPVTNNYDPRLTASFQHVIAPPLAIVQTMSQLPMPLHDKQNLQAPVPINALGHSGVSEPVLHGSSVREEGEVPDSELDPDTMRRLLISQHGQDRRDNTLKDSPVPVRSPAQILVPAVESLGNLFPLEEEMSLKKSNRTPKEFALDSEHVCSDKYGVHNPSWFLGRVKSLPSDRTLRDHQRLSKEAHHGNDWPRRNHVHPNYRPSTGEEISFSQSSASNKDLNPESRQVSVQFSETPAGVLQEIAKKLGTKVKFKSSLLPTTELRFSIEAWFSGEKIGEGIGKTRKEAQHRAAESSLKYLANKYLSLISLDPNALQGEYSKLCHSIESGFVRDPNSFGYPIFLKDDTSQIAKNLNQPRFIDQRFDGFKNSVSSVATLKELCTLEGVSLRFTEQPSFSTDSGPKGEIFAQVEIGEQILGKGIGSTWDEAKEHAAEEALGRIQSMLGQKRIGSPRLQANLNKHSMPEFSRVLQRTPSSDRYYKNGVSIP